MKRWGAGRLKLWRTRRKTLQAWSLEEFQRAGKPVEPRLYSHNQDAKHNCCQQLRNLDAQVCQEGVMLAAAVESDFLGWHKGCNTWRAESPCPGVLRRAVVFRRSHLWLFLIADTVASLAKGQHWKKRLPTKGFYAGRVWGSERADHGITPT